MSLEKYGIYICNQKFTVMVDNFAKNLILLLVVSLSAMSCGTIIGMQSVNEPPWWPFEIEKSPKTNGSLDFANQYVGTSFPGDIITLEVGNGQLIGIQIEPKLDPLTGDYYNKIIVYESLVDDQFKRFVDTLNFQQ